MDNHTHIVFFDGICGLCNGFVDFMIKNDKKQVFKFCSLQSEFAKNKLAKHQFDSEKLETVVLLSDNQLFIKSKAVLRIFKLLPFPYKILYYMCFWIPTVMSDFVYDWIAKNRYIIFGKKETCRLPNANETNRFLKE